MLNIKWNAKDLQKVSNKLEQVKKNVQTKTNRRFLELSLEWLHAKSVEYLEMNFPENELSSLIAEISNSFEKEISGNMARLINNHKNAVYIEFGVGIVGQGTHPTSSNAKIGGGNYEYNIPSKAKEYAQEKTGQPNSWFYRGLTQGNRAAMYMYNAFMDFQGGVYKTIYEQAFQETFAKIGK